MPILKVDVLTLFPKMFDGPLTESILGRARKSGLVEINIHSLRDWSDDKKHKKVDAPTYGGGAGMVLQPEPIFRALKSLKKTKKKSKAWVVYLSPKGKTLNQKDAQKLAKKKHLILLCGHYEGVDQRILDQVDQEVSIGDYILTGGEIPAMVLVDTVARLVPGVVGDPDSIKDESFSDGLLEYPHYTRPRRWRGKAVPKVLLSGHHKKIDQWRQAAALKETKKKKPELINLK